MLMDYKPVYSISNSGTIAAVALGIVSCLFSALTLLVLIKMRSTSSAIGIRPSSIAMLFSLVGADLLRGFFNLTGMIRYLVIYILPVGPHPENPCSRNTFCEIQSFFSIWFNMIVFICIFFIGIFAIYQIAGLPEERRTIKYKTLTITTVFCWFIPFLLTLIPAFYGVLGEDQKTSTNGWCWITSCNKTDDKIRVTFMLLYSKAVEAVIILVNLTLFIYLQFIIWKRKKLIGGIFKNVASESISSRVIPENNHENITNDSKLLFFINFSITLSHLWGITRTGCNIISIYDVYGANTSELFKNTQDILLIFQAVFENLQSVFVFAVLFLCSKFVKIFLKYLFCKCQYSLEESLHLR